MDGLLSLPRVYFWPTIWVDFISQVPVFVLWSFFYFDFECTFKKRVWSNLGEPWDPDNDNTTDYIGSVVLPLRGGGDTNNIQISGNSISSQLYARPILFLVWTLQVLLTCNVVYFHLTVRHHPKFYVGRANRIAIVSHIIGGTTANLGGYLGFITNQQTLIKVASIFGLLLHVPSAYWQARNLHGRREIMQPAYFFLGSWLLVKYADVWFDKGSMESVMSMGYAVNGFALVRLYFRLQLNIGMDYELSYDRALMFGAMSNVPIALGPTGCLQMVMTIFVWNALLNILMEDGSRGLLQVNRSVADVFPDTFNGKPVNYRSELRKYRKIYPDDRLAVARAAFHIIAGEDNVIQLEEMEELFEGWGLPDAKNVAFQVFGRADGNNDGVISFDEFKKELWFIWERLHYVGEAESDKDGKLQVTHVQDATSRRESFKNFSEFPVKDETREEEKKKD